MLNEKEYERLQEIAGKSFPEDRKELDLLLKKGGAYLGSGSGREAWRMEVEGWEPFCFKFAHRDPLSIKGVLTSLVGIEQTEAEVRAFQNLDHEWIPVLYDWHPDFYWVEMELLEEIETKDLPTLELINSFNREYFLDDIDDPNQWGRNSKGQIKILDLGFYAG